MEVRKLQSVGGSTLFVSLPKSYVDSLGLKKGAFVKVSEAGRVLTIEPLDGNSDEESFDIEG